MTREEVINVLDTVAWNAGGADRDEIIEAVNIAIKVLSGQYKKNISCGFISREDALLSVENSIINWCERNYLKDKAEDCVRYVQDGIEEIPSVSVDRVMK